MNQKELSTDILIVGGGPAGISTALHLIALQPDLADHILVLEKKNYPREKVCGGAISESGAVVLRRLQLPFEFPFVAIDTIRVHYQDQAYDLTGKPVVRIVHRAEFDQWFANQAREAGVRILEEHAFVSMQNAGDGFLVHTNQTTIRTRMLVAADGSRSAVKKQLGWHHAQSIARLIEYWQPANPLHELYHTKRLDLFFNVLDQGIQGYSWDFPSRVDGEAKFNRGLFDSRVHSNRPMQNLKQHLSTEDGQAMPDIKGHPLNCFSAQQPMSQPGILLVGDAAGGDPLFGEGISYALEYGYVAAQEILRGLTRQDLSFRDYNQRILANPLLAELNRRTRYARIAYAIKSPWLRKMGWRLAGLVASRIRWTEPEKHLQPMPD